MSTEYELDHICSYCLSIASAIWLLSFTNNPALNYLDRKNQLIRFLLRFCLILLDQKGPFPLSALFSHHFDTRDFLQLFYVLQHFYQHELENRFFPYRDSKICDTLLSIARLPIPVL